MLKPNTVRKTTPPPPRPQYLLLLPPKKTTTKQQQQRSGRRRSILHGVGDTVAATHVHDGELQVGAGLAVVADVGRPGHARALSLQEHAARVLPSLDARADGVQEGLAEVARHEAVDERVDTGVDVGQQVEGLPHGLEVTVVKVLQHLEGRQHVGDQDRRPADHEDGDHGYQHLDHLLSHTKDLYVGPIHTVV